VSTEIDTAADKALIHVADDGHGIVPEAERGNRPAGRGIANMRRRAEAVGGAIAIDSSPQGTRITLELPLR
jgi:signal transduction histidine kinase